MIDQKAEMEIKRLIKLNEAKNLLKLLEEWKEEQSTSLTLVKCTCGAGRFEKIEINFSRCMKCSW